MHAIIAKVASLRTFKIDVVLVCETKQIVSFVGLNCLQEVPFRILEVYFDSIVRFQPWLRREPRNTYPVPGAGRVMPPWRGTARKVKDTRGVCTTHLHLREILDSEHPALADVIQPLPPSAVCVMPWRWRMPPLSNSGLRVVHIAVLYRSAYVLAKQQPAVLVLRGSLRAG